MTASTTEATTMTTADALPTPRPGAARVDAASALLFGTLTWLGWVWVVGAIGNVIALGLIARWGELSQSLWAPAFIGWQHWVIGGAGVTAVAVFLELFVVHGATRRVVAWGAAANAVVLAVAIAAIAGIGFVIEGWWFRRQGWPHRVVDDGMTSTDIGVWTIVAAVAITAAATYVSGWLAGALWMQRVSSGLPFLLPLALIPTAVAQWLVAGAAGVAGVDVLTDLHRPSWWIGIPVTLALTALGGWAATALTRRIELR